ncbi:alpha/beta hydrolase [Lujinxingia vulgaris]|uniref:Alpha/beta hydrolase n=1 Tax=Lujinxingia vulgaris TaxID=2600176 RepID=A0A5C6XK64_9DELT|nr:alpha/beta hydrolase [Lujinxingia vulgaris]TXD42689.1 alpha/beta hydrolase [Lujinxingia vulgaris]
MKTGFVLIHGAGLGGWIWRDVETQLKQPALAVDFPGRALTPGQRGVLSLNDYVADVQAQIEAFECERVILVAHSIGGVLALPIAAALGDRVAGMVAIGAAIPNDGGSFASCLPLPKRLLMKALIRVMGTRPPESVIGAGLGSDLSAELSAELVERFAPESAALYFEDCQAAVPEVPRWYVRLTADKEFGDALQAKMIANLGTQKVVDVASGHLPMLSQAEALSAHLNAFAREIEG